MTALLYYLHTMPGPSLLILEAGAIGLVVSTALATWQLCKIYYERQWARFAPAKARDVVREARREAAESLQRCRELEADNVELRGMREAVRQAVAEPRRLELVERREVGGR